MWQCQQCGHAWDDALIVCQRCWIAKGAATATSESAEEACLPGERRPIWNRHPKPDNLAPARSALFYVVAIVVVAVLNGLEETWLGPNQSLWHDCLFFGKYDPSGDCDLGETGPDAEDSDLLQEAD